MSPKPLFSSSPRCFLLSSLVFKLPARCSSLALRSDTVHLAALPICFVRWLTYGSMVISFKLSRVGTRYRPRVRSGPKSLALEDGPSGHPKSDESPVSLLGLSGFDNALGCYSHFTQKHENQSPCLTDFSNHSGEHEASFSLNLYPDGFYIGKPTEGTLLPPLQDVSELLHPYDRISETLFSVPTGIIKGLLTDVLAGIIKDSSLTSSPLQTRAIENGRLPGNILDDIPCKYYKGSVFCEVWDFRSCMSECDSSCAHSPKVQKVCLRMSTEDVVRDMQSISDDSWSYNDFLQVESQIIKALHPKLYLHPKPSLKRFFEEPVSKKLDLGIKWRWTKKQHKKHEFGSKSIPTDISGSRTIENIKQQTSCSPKHAKLTFAVNAFLGSMPLIQQNRDLNGVSLHASQMISKPCNVPDAGWSISPLDHTVVDSITQGRCKASHRIGNQLHAESPRTCDVKRPKKWSPSFHPPQLGKDALSCLEEKTAVCLQKQQSIQNDQFVYLSDHRSTTDTSTIKVPDEVTSVSIRNKESKQKLPMINYLSFHSLLDDGLHIQRIPDQGDTCRKRKFTRCSQVSTNSPDKLVAKKAVHLSTHRFAFLEATAAKLHKEDTVTVSTDSVETGSLAFVPDFPLDNAEIPSHILDDEVDKTNILKKLSIIQEITQRHGLGLKVNKADSCKTTREYKHSIKPPDELFINEDIQGIGGSGNTCKVHILTYKREEFFFAGNNLLFFTYERYCKLALTGIDPSNHMVVANIIYSTDKYSSDYLHLKSHYAGLFAAQFTSLMERDGYKLVNNNTYSMEHDGYKLVNNNTSEDKTDHSSCSFTSSNNCMPTAQLHSCSHQKSAVSTRIGPSASLTRPPKMDFMQQQFCVGIPNSVRPLSFVPFQQSPQPPQGNLQSKMASVRTENDDLCRPHVSGSNITQMSGTNNSCQPVSHGGFNKTHYSIDLANQSQTHRLGMDINFGMKHQRYGHGTMITRPLLHHPLVRSNAFLLQGLGKSPQLSNKSSMNFYSLAHHQQYHMQSDSSEGLLNSQNLQCQQFGFRLPNISVNANIRESTPVSSQQFSRVGSRQVDLGIRKK